MDFFLPVREPAIPVHPDDLRMLEDVRLAGWALQALAAGHMHFGGYEVAFLHAGHFVANSLDHAAEFVPWNKRRMDATLRLLVPVVDMQVGAADRG